MLYKYPRTYHLPSSPGKTYDDKVLTSMSSFLGRQVVITEKMDGENTTMYQERIHARSLDSRHHDSRAWVKQFWSEIRFNIPRGYRICGENLYARHSISYQNLSSYFLGFSVWDENNFCLSYSETLDWMELIGVQHVPVLYIGEFTLEVLEEMSGFDSSSQEGFVVRLEEAFSFTDFSISVAKYVRPEHVTTDAHWMRGAWVKNGLLV